MNMKEITEHLRKILFELEQLQEDQINEMGKFYTKLPFSDFRNEILLRYNNRKNKFQISTKKQH